MSLDTDSLEDFEQVEKVFDKLTLEGSPATSASSGCQNGPITRSKTAKGKVFSLMKSKVITSYDLVMKTKRLHFETFISFNLTPKLPGFGNFK